MGYTIINPPQSYVQFNTPITPNNCDKQKQGALPVYEEADVAFQFVIKADTTGEANDICGLGAASIEIGLVFDCDQPDFTAQFPEMPAVQRIDETRVNVDWSHGLTGMIGAIQEDQCFRIMVRLGELSFCSNVFRRITQQEACDTSVLEYANNENAFGFVYCGNADGVDNPEITTCDPIIVTFFSQTNLVIPYTALLASQFGQVPTVQVWIYDENGYPTNMGVEAKFDQLPPTQILIDLGGPASGFIVIR